MLTATPLTVPLTAPIRPQRYRTLVRVELRKMTDTRSGKLLLGAVVGLAAVLLGWKLFHTSTLKPSFINYDEALAPPVAFLLPLVGLLAMTSEWSQRTALTTFTMSPRRLRVFSAKITAAVALSVVAIAAALVLVVGATLLGGLIAGHPGSFHDMGGELRIMVIASLLQVLRGAATGALIPLSSAAIAAYVFAPTVWTAVAPSLLHGSSRWLDIFETYDRLASHHPGSHLPQTITSILAWVALPLAAGLYRSVRREVK